MTIICYSWGFKNDSGWLDYRVGFESLEGPVVYVYTKNAVFGPQQIFKPKLNVKYDRAKYLTFIILNSAFKNFFFNTKKLYGGVLYRN